MRIRTSLGGGLDRRSDRKQTGLVVSSQFTFARWGFDATLRMAAKMRIAI
jgi:hypothetical protein